ncbi:MAG: DUF4384 domain-containing protein [Deltaproteobacteria bacterium]|nr:DUF4384 domain-containing protein [Deltaproteobacteria bacterium]
MRIITPCILVLIWLLLPVPGAPAWAQTGLLTVQSTGRAELGQGTREEVREKARSEAIRKAIEEHAGVVITSQSTMSNFEMTEDVVKSYSRVYFKSIREISYVYNEATRIGTYQGEFVIDTASMNQMAQAQQQLSANRDVPVGAAVFLFDGDGRIIAQGEEVSAGRQFNLMLRPETDLHAYVVGRDSRGRLAPIFPNRAVSSHANPLQAGQTYYFPPRDSSEIFIFDEHIGTETFFILLSAAPLSDLDALFSQMDSSGDNQELTPIVTERIASRGGGLSSTPVRGDLMLSGGTSRKVDSRIGEAVAGKGAFVKTITLRHVD